MSTFQQHNQWVRMMQDQGWSHGPEYDEAAKKHPRMVPFDQLPPDEVIVDMHEAVVVEEVPAADLTVEPERERRPKKPSRKSPPRKEGVSTDG
jgi:hypothetical protein